jgi:hypothetical protein
MLVSVLDVIFTVFFVLSSCVYITVDLFTGNTWFNSLQNIEIFFGSV